MRHLIFATLLAAIPATALAQERIGPAVGVGAVAKPANTNTQWNQAEIVFVGELTEAVAGPVGMSFPPLYTNRLKFKSDRVLRGTLADPVVACGHSVRAEANYPFEVGKKYIVSLNSSRGGFAVGLLRPSDDAAIREVEQSCSLPFGWTMTDGKASSPWASLGKAGWAAELPADLAVPKLVCDKTGRPAFLVPAAAVWTVEVVPPKKAIQWTNPDGDGEYKLTLTNPTDQPLTIPALLTQDGKVLWTECVAISCQTRGYMVPGAKGISGKVSPLVLKPKESVSTVINALSLNGPEWPRGGYRIEFTFCLGDKAKTMSFYYMSRHHDALRNAAQKK